MGCFGNSTEIELSVDGDETFYVDFQGGELVFTYPPFVSTMVPSIFDNHHMFVNAKKNKRVCHDVLSAMTLEEKNPPEEQGKAGNSQHLCPGGRAGGGGGFPEMLWPCLATQYQ